MNTQQSYLNNSLITRVTKEIRPKLVHMFNVTVSDNPYIDRDMRDTILSKWHNEYPSIALTTWRVYLTRLEQKHYADTPKWDQDALINKITVENEYLTSRVLKESAKDITFQAKTINEMNSLTAKIHKLTDAPAQVNLYIESNIDEDNLTKSILKGQYEEIEIFDVGSSEPRTSTQMSKNETFDVESHTSDDVSSEKKTDEVAP